MRERDLQVMAREIDGALRAIRKALNRPLAAEVARGNLTAAQRNVMEILVRSEGLSLKALSREAGLAHSTVSGIVDRLEKRGMVARKADEKDGRFSRIVVTDVVRDFVREKIPMLTAGPLVEALGRATPSQRAKVLGGVRVLQSLLAGE